MHLLINHICYYTIFQLLEALWVGKKSAKQNPHLTWLTKCMIIDWHVEQK